MDTRLLKDSFAAVAPRAGELIEYFYADLFSRGGLAVREMFPPSMTAQRDRLLGALIHTITGIDDLEATAGYLAALGRDHRKFGADQEQAYALVGESLLVTLAHFAGDAWTPEVAATWGAAYGLIANVMLDGARADADAGNPPWWDATVTGVDRRTPDVAVIAARLSQPMERRPGQSVSVKFGGMPWRLYSPANAVNQAAVVFHVHAVPGGMTSTHLVQHAETGSKLRIGPPVGSFTWDASRTADIVMAAYSTGLAPIKAIIEQIAGQRDNLPRPRVHLGYFARDLAGLYDLEDLEKMADSLPWLSLTHALAARGGGPDFTPGPVAGRDAYVAGPGSFVTAVPARLRELGAVQVYTENYAWEGSING